MEVWCLWIGNGFYTILESAAKARTVCSFGGIQNMTSA
jgi:hypothetical protein